MYALMHIAHLSVCSLQTFSDPLAVHTSLSLSLSICPNHTVPRREEM